MYFSICSLFLLFLYPSHSIRRNMEMRIIPVFLFVAIIGVIVFYCPLFASRLLSYNSFLRSAAAVVAPPPDDGYSCIASTSTVMRHFVFSRRSNHKTKTNCHLFELSTRQFHIIEWPSGPIPTISLSPLVSQSLFSLSDSWRNTSIFPIVFALLPDDNFSTPSAIDHSQRRNKASVIKIYDHARTPPHTLPTPVHIQSTHVHWTHNTQKRKCSKVFIFIFPVPPDEPKIFDTHGKEVLHVAGPFREGQEFFLSCQVNSGK